MDYILAYQYRAKACPVYPGSDIKDTNRQVISAFPCVRLDYKFVSTESREITRYTDLSQQKNKKYSYYYNDDNYMYQPLNATKDTKAIMVVHGLGDSPDTMNPMFVRLQKLYPDRAIFMISLPHNVNGLRKRNLDTKKAADAIRDNYNVISSKYDHVNIIAHSFGGAMTIDLACKDTFNDKTHLILIAPCLGSIVNELSLMQKCTIGIPYYIEKMFSKYCEAITAFWHGWMPMYSISQQKLTAFGNKAHDVILTRLMTFIDLDVCVSHCSSVYADVNKTIESGGQKFKNAHLICLTQDTAVPAEPIKNLAAQIQSKYSREGTVLHSLDMTHCGFLYNTSNMDNLMDTIQNIMPMNP